MKTKDLDKEILALLKHNARMSNAEIADRLNTTEAKAAAAIAKLEADGQLLGYAAITASETDGDQVRAIIEVQVQPERVNGFNKVARQLAHFDEVVSVYLVSGRYDLHLEVVGRSLQDVAHFVASKLSSQSGVKSCATLFLLKKYKEAGIELDKEEKYERLKVVP